MSKLSYIEGDATNPQSNDNKHMVIPHVVNDEGKWGSGFVLALSSEWSEPEAVYRRDANNNELRLGRINGVRVEPNITVINMCAQHKTGDSRLEMLARDAAWYNNHPDLDGFDKIGTGRSRPPIRYGFLSKCMSQVGAFCRADAQSWASIHAPRFGSGLAGGNWDVIEQMILEHWVDNGIDVTIYDLS